jgi:basic membrane protein A
MPSRRRILKAGGVGLTIGLAGCSTNSDGGDGSGSDGGDGSGSDGGDGSGSTDTGDGTDSGEPAAQIGMIYALGGTGDESFSDAANAGLNEAAEQFGIAFDDAGPQSND